LLRRSSLFLPLIFLSGCLSNSVVPLDPRTAHAPSPDKGIAVFGLAIEESPATPAFGVVLDEYSPVDKSITGNCWRYTHMRAAIPARQYRAEHFAFEVPPGHYVYSGFNAAGLKGGAVAFEVPAGGAVYLGEFILTKGQAVELRRQPLQSGPALAKVSAVPAPNVFLCAP
jgi:hypothetical protein